MSTKIPRRLAVRPTVEDLRRIFALQPDGGLVWLESSKTQVVGRQAGAISSQRSGRKLRVVVQINRRLYQRARIVFCMTTGHWAVGEVDHINGNSLDDSPENLREATRQQNNWNVKKVKKKSDLPMGVKLTRQGTYQARIKVNRKQHCLGILKRGSSLRPSARLRAHSIFQTALRRGDIVKPLACEECSRVVDPFLLRAHHSDHLLPLDVVWLCTSCHVDRNLEAYLAGMFAPIDWSPIAAKAKRDDVDLRDLVFGWLSEWANK